MMRFSDAFMKHTKQPELEVTCMVYNLNAEENRELLKKSRTLYGYTVYVEKVRNLKGTGLPLAQAIDRAIEECIEENVLSEFFRTRRNEVEKVTQLDFTWERQEELLKLEYLEEGREEGRAEGREEGREEGRAEGRAEGRTEGRAEGRTEGQELTLIRMIIKKLHKNKSPEQIAEDLEEDIPKIRHICEVAERFVPEYDVEKIYHALQNESVREILSGGQL